MSLGEYVARESAVALVFTNTCRWSGTSLGSLRKPEVPVLPGDLDATENTPDEMELGSPRRQLSRAAPSPRSLTGAAAGGPGDAHIDKIFRRNNWLAKLLLLIWGVGHPRHTSNRASGSQYTRRDFCRITNLMDSRRRSRRLRTSRFQDERFIGGPDVRHFSTEFRILDRRGHGLRPWLYCGLAAVERRSPDRKLSVRS